MRFVKLQVSITPSVHQTLSKEADHRGTTVQELIRAVVLPEWIAHAKPIEAKK